MSNQIAQTILAQLGGNKFIAMTGTKNLVSDTRSLKFHIGRGALSKINMVRISVTSYDLYTVEFFNYRKFEAKEVAKFEGIYADNLQKVFTQNTGFYTNF